MFVAYDLAIPVVIQHDKIGAPPDENCEARVQTDTYGRSKTLRP